MRFTAGMLGIPLVRETSERTEVATSVLRVAKTPSASGWRCRARAGIRSWRLAVGLLVPLFETRLPIAPVAMAARPTVAATPAAPERAAQQEEDQDEEEEREEEPESAEEEWVVVDRGRRHRGAARCDPLRDAEVVRADAHDEGDDERDDESDDASHVLVLLSFRARRRLRSDREAGVKVLGRALRRLAQDRVEPARRGFDRLRLGGAEVVAGTRDDDEVDARVAARDALEHAERTELVALALHHERGAGDGLEGGLVVGSRPARRRDRMTEDGERVRRLGPREERAHPSAERTADERDPLRSLLAQPLACAAQVRELALVCVARPRAARREGDRTCRDAVLRQASGKSAEDGLPVVAAVPGREHHRARAQAGTFGSFCASSSEGASRSPTCSRRGGVFAIVEGSGRPREGVASHRRGADTGARRIGRTL